MAPDLRKTAAVMQAAGRFDVLGPPAPQSFYRLAPHRELPMLVHLKLGTVREVIRLADAARAADPPEESGGFVDLTDDRLEEVARMKPEQVALREYLKGLSDDQMAELMALAWLGRGDGGAKARDFPDLLAHARTTLDHAPAYLSQKAPLGSYLRDGLSRLGK